MNASLTRWTPAVLLVVGAILTVGVDTQRAMALRAPLGQMVPGTIAGYEGTDAPISEDEIRVVGVTDYLYRVFERGAREASPVDGSDTGAEASAGASAPFTLYIGYYDQQSRGKTIHSPKNCLPGAGWEALTSTTRAVRSEGRSYTVNQYLIKRGDQQAMVFYWYQGRGRVESNEYRVKFDLLRDSALRGRSDEALVRLVVPVVESEAQAVRLAEEAAAQVIPAVKRALPA
jgi:EpsI family protein